MTEQEVTYYALRSAGGGLIEMIKVTRRGPKAGAAAMTDRRVALFDDKDAALAAMQRGNGVA